VHPYPGPLSIRPYDGGARVRLPVSEIGGEVGRAPRFRGAVPAQPVSITQKPSAKWPSGIPASFALPPFHPSSNASRSSTPSIWLA
jgi:hypothetical protein